MNLYAIYALIAISLFSGGFINGCSYQQNKAEKTIRDKEHQYQNDADKIRIEKDAQINAINSQLVNSIAELRKRTSRTSETNNGQATKACDGSELFAEDSEFLVREAARADTIRIALQACYNQYDSLK
jgi:site-specific DNA-adenine methylase